MCFIIKIWRGAAEGTLPGLPARDCLPERAISQCQQTTSKDILAILAGAGSAFAKRLAGEGRSMISPSKQCLEKSDLDRSQPRSLFTLMKMEGTNCPWKTMSQTWPLFKHVPRFVSNPNRSAFLQRGLQQLPQWEAELDSCWPGRWSLRLLPRVCAPVVARGRQDADARLPS